MIRGGGKEDEELPGGEDYSATENSLGGTYGTSHKPVTPELDRERFSTAAKLQCTPGAALQARQGQL